jgi:hypothetical protein
MATGTAWNVEDDPLKPCALFDTNARRVIPFELADWLAEMGTTYGSHEVIAESPLECVSSPYSADVLALTMKLRAGLVAGEDYNIGQKYPFTVRLTGADGQIDDRTLWLKLMDR